MKKKLFVGMIVAVFVCVFACGACGFDEPLEAHETDAEKISMGDLVYIVEKQRKQTRLQNLYGN
jgi:hypothetical protein